MKTKFKIGFKPLMLGVGILPMVLVSVFIAIMCSRMMENNLMDAQYKVLKTTSYTLKEYFQYDVINNGAVDYDEYADHKYMNMLQNMGIEQTLFQGDTRFLTSIKGSDGKYFENTKANADIWAAVRSGKEYSAENVTINNAPYMVYYVPVFADASHKEVWGMAFAGVPMTAVNDSISSMRTRVILFISLFLVAFGILILLLSNVLAKTLKGVVSNVSELADGDLSEKPFKESMCNEFNNVAEAIDNTQKKLKHTVSSIQRSYEGLNKTVYSVDELSSSSNSGIQQATGLISEMAHTAVSMAENVQNVNTAVIDMGSSIDSISESSGLASERAKNMLKANTDSLKSIKSVFESNEKSVQAIIEINDKTRESAEAVNAIKSAADVITNIAGQTNLLALNASIEAARAGESGRGFAVVAENIRELAEQSNLSAQDIRKSVEDVVAKVESCADMANDAKDLMFEQQELVKNVSDNMENFSIEVNDVVSDITKVSSEVESLNAVKGSILSNVSDLSAISEENAASAEEVSSNMDIISDNVNRTKDESSKMRDLANELNNELKYFK